MFLRMYEQIRQMEWKMTQDRIKMLEDALRPFSIMAGELFARNWCSDDVVLSFEWEGQVTRLT